MVAPCNPYNNHWELTLPTVKTLLFRLTRELFRLTVEPWLFITIRHWLLLLCVHTPLFLYFFILLVISSFISVKIKVKTYQCLSLLSGSLSLVSPNKLHKTSLDSEGYHCYESKFCDTQTYISSDTLSMSTHFSFVKLFTIKSGHLVLSIQTFKLSKIISQMWIITSGRSEVLKRRREVRMDPFFIEKGDE